MNEEKKIIYTTLLFSDSLLISIVTITRLYGDVSINWRMNELFTHKFSRFPTFSNSEVEDGNN